MSEAFPWWTVFSEADPKQQQQQEASARSATPSAAAKPLLSSPMQLERLEDRITPRGGIFEIMNWGTMISDPNSTPPGFQPDTYTVTEAGTDGIFGTPDDRVTQVPGSTTFQLGRDLIRPITDAELTPEERIELDLTDPVNSAYTFDTFTQLKDTFNYATPPAGIFTTVDQDPAGRPEPGDPGTLGINVWRQLATEPGTGLPIRTLSHATPIPYPQAPPPYLPNFETLVTTDGIGQRNFPVFTNPGVSGRPILAADTRTALLYGEMLDGQISANVLSLFDGGNVGPANVTGASTGVGGDVAGLVFRYDEGADTINTFDDTYYWGSVVQVAAHQTPRPGFVQPNGSEFGNIVAINNVVTDPLTLEGQLNSPIVGIEITTQQPHGLSSGLEVEIDNVDTFEVDTNNDGIPERPSIPINGIYRITVTGVNTFRIDFPPGDTSLALVTQLGTRFVYTDNETPNPDIPPAQSPQLGKWRLTTPNVRLSLERVISQGQIQDVFEEIDPDTQLPKLVWQTAQPHGIPLGTRVQISIFGIVGDPAANNWNLEVEATAPNRFEADPGYIADVRATTNFNINDLLTNPDLIQLPGNSFNGYFRVADIIAQDYFDTFRATSALQGRLTVSAVNNQFTIQFNAETLDPRQPNNVNSIATATGFDANPLDNPGTRVASDYELARTTTGGSVGFQVGVFNPTVAWVDNVERTSLLDTDFWKDLSVYNPVLDTLDAYNSPAAAIPGGVGNTGFPNAPAFQVYGAHNFTGNLPPQFEQSRAILPRNGGLFGSSVALARFGDYKDGLVRSRVNVANVGDRLGVIARAFDSDDNGLEDSYYYGEIVRTAANSYILQIFGVRNNTGVLLASRALPNGVNDIGQLSLITHSKVGLIENVENLGGAATFVSTDHGLFDGGLVRIEAGVYSGTHVVEVVDNNRYRLRALTGNNTVGAFLPFLQGATGDWFANDLTLIYQDTATQIQHVLSLADVATVDQSVKNDLNRAGGNGIRGAANPNPATAGLENSWFDDFFISRIKPRVATSDLAKSPNEAIVIAASGVILDLKGFDIDGQDDLRDNVLYEGATRQGYGDHLILDGSQDRTSVGIAVLNNVWFGQDPRPTLLDRTDDPEFRGNNDFIIITSSRSLTDPREATGDLLRSDGVDPNGIVSRDQEGFIHSEIRNVSVAVTVFSSLNGPRAPGDNRPTAGGGAPLTSLEISNLRIHSAAPHKMRNLINRDYHFNAQGQLQQEVSTSAVGYGAIEFHDYVGSFSSFTPGFGTNGTIGGINGTVDIDGDGVGNGIVVRNNIIHGIQGPAISVASKNNAVAISDEVPFSISSATGLLIKDNVIYHTGYTGFGFDEQGNYDPTQDGVPLYYDAPRRTGDVFVAQFNPFNPLQQLEQGAGLPAPFTDAPYNTTRSLVNGDPATLFPTIDPQGQPISLQQSLEGNFGFDYYGSAISLDAGNSIITGNWIFNNGANLASFDLRGDGISFRGGINFATPLEFFTGTPFWVENSVNGTGAIQGYLSSVRIERNSIHSNPFGGIHIFDFVDDGNDTGNASIVSNAIIRNGSLNDRFLPYTQESAGDYGLLLPEDADTLLVSGNNFGRMVDSDGNGNYDSPVLDGSNRGNGAFQYDFGDGAYSGGVGDVGDNASLAATPLNLLAPDIFYDEEVQFASITQTNFIIVADANSDFVQVSVAPGLYTSQIDRNSVEPRPVPALFLLDTQRIRIRYAGPDNIFGNDDDTIFAPTRSFLSDNQITLETGFPARDGKYQVIYFGTGAPIDLADDPEFPINIPVDRPGAMVDTTGAQNWINGDSDTFSNAPFNDALPGGNFMQFFEIRSRIPFVDQIISRETTGDPAQGLPPVAFGDLGGARQFQVQFSGDFDGDSFRDDIAHFDAFQNQWLVSTSNGQILTTRRWDQGFPQENYVTHIVANVDGQNGDDIVSVTEDGELFVQISTGGNPPPGRFNPVGNPWIIDTGILSAIRIEVGDFDGDGDQDLATLEGDQWFIYQAEPGLVIGQNPFFEKLAATGPVPSTYRDYASGDFDGDGVDDLVALNDSNGQNTLEVLLGTPVVVNGNLITSFTIELWGAARENIPYIEILSLDFDGDGRDDVALLDPTTSSFIFLRAEETGFLTFGVSGETLLADRFDLAFTATTDVDIAALSQFQIVDFNGDRREDIAAFNDFTNQWIAFTSRGDSVTRSLLFDPRLPEFVNNNIDTNNFRFFIGNFDGDTAGINEFSTDDFVTYDPTTGVFRAYLVDGDNLLIEDLDGSLGINEINTTFVGANGSRLDAAEWQDTRVGSVRIQNNAATGAELRENVATFRGGLATDVRVESDIVGANVQNALGLLARYSGVGDTNTYLGMFVNHSSRIALEIWRNNAGVYTLLAREFVNAPTVSNARLIFELVGRELRFSLVYGDGDVRAGQNRIVRVVDNSVDAILTPGATGLRAFMYNPLASGYTNFQVRNLRRTQYVDTFNQANPISLGTEFTYVSRPFGDPTPTASSFTIAGTGRVPTDGSLSGVSLVDGLVGRNFEAEVDVPGLAEGDGFIVGLRLQDDGRTGLLISYYVFNGRAYINAYRTNNGVITVLDDDVNTFVDGDPLPAGGVVPPGQTRPETGRLRVRVEGAEIRIFIDERLVKTTLDTAIIGNENLAVGGFGLAGIDSFGDNSLVYDNLNVVVLDDDFSPIAEDFNIDPRPNLGPNWTHLGESQPTINGDGQAVHLPNSGIMLELFDGVYRQDVAVSADVFIPAIGRQSAQLVARYQFDEAGNPNFYVGLLLVDTTPSFNNVNGAKAFIWRFYQGRWTLLAESAQLGTTIIDPQEPLQLRFEVEGDQLRFYIGDDFVAGAEDSTITGPGQVGIRGTNFGQPVLYDAFRVEAIQSVPTNFVVADDFDREPNFTLGSNWITGQSRITEQGTAQTQIAIWESLEARDLDVSATVRLNPNQLDGVFGGVMARFQGESPLVSNNNSYYAAVVLNVGGVTQVQLWRKDGDAAPTVLATLDLAGGVIEEVNIRLLTLTPTPGSTVVAVFVNFPDGIVAPFLAGLPIVFNDNSGLLLNAGQTGLIGSDLDNVTFDNFRARNNVGLV